MNAPRSALALTLATALTLACPGLATELQVSLDPDSTHVGFGVQATGHDVEGLLYLQAGEIRFDPETGSASGEITLDARRAETGNDKRDKAMHRKVLESETFPLIVFRPERVEGTVAASGSSEIQLHGTVSVHGTEHPLVLATEVQADGDHLTIHAKFPIPYVEWGMHNPSLLVLRVAKVVDVIVDAEATLQPAGSALSASLMSNR